MLEGEILLARQRLQNRCEERDRAQATLDELEKKLAERDQLELFPPDTFFVRREHFSIVC